MYEWVEATGLRPILNGLGDADRERFVEVYRERLRAAYPRRTGGHTLYPFRRLFMVVTGAGELRGAGSPRLHFDSTVAGLVRWTRDACPPVRHVAHRPDRGWCRPEGGRCAERCPAGARERHPAPVTGGEAATRTESFVGAAESLDMSTSAVSRQIKAREVHLGAEPFTGAQP